MSERLLGVRRPPPRGLAACWALGVAGLGLALAVLGPPPAAPGPPAPLGPRTVVAQAERQLPPGSLGVRIAAVSGSRTAGLGWTFVVDVIYRSRSSRLAEREVELPRPRPVPSALFGQTPEARLPALYQRSWPASRLAAALDRVPGIATTVRFQPPGPPTSS